MSYGQAVQGWHDFYVTAGAAAATLVGLLFVGLSLHIRVVVAHPDDEGGVTPYLARAIYDEHKRVAVVYTTRGGSGGGSASRTVSGGNPGHISANCCSWTAAFIAGWKTVAERVV